MALTPDNSTLEMMMKAGGGFEKLMTHTTPGFGDSFRKHFDKDVESMYQIPPPFELSKFAKVSNMNMGDVKLACGELKQMFDTPHKLTGVMFKSLGEQFLNNDYMFLVDEYDDIDFDKIKDDLDYAEPFVIVNHNGEFTAVVHFSVFDKHCRSIRNNIQVHSAISNGVCKIDQKEINAIKSQIKKIKQSQWKSLPESEVTPTLVTVVQVNV